MPVPSCLPRPGRRLGPKIRSAITRTMISSGAPMFGIACLSAGVGGPASCQSLFTRLAPTNVHDRIKFMGDAPIYGLQRPANVAFRPGTTIMSQPTNSNGQYVRRVTLPSGRSIEVVYFEAETVEHAVAQSAGQHQVDELH